MSLKLDDSKEHSVTMNEEAAVPPPAIDERKLLWKMDMACVVEPARRLLHADRCTSLIPWLSFLYLLSFLDRTSIGNAKVRPTVSNSVLDTRALL